MTLVDWKLVVEAMDEMSYHLEKYTTISSNRIDDFDAKGYAKEMLEFILEIEEEK